MIKLSALTSKTSQIERGKIIRVAQTRQFKRVVIKTLSIGLTTGDYQVGNLRFPTVGE